MSIVKGRFISYYSAAEGLRRPAAVQKKAKDIIFARAAELGVVGPHYYLLLCLLCLSVSVCLSLSVSLSLSLSLSRTGCYIGPNGPNATILEY